jgi:hypothetical protein
MTAVLRLIEDWLAGGTRSTLASETPRALYVAGGSITVNGNALNLDEGLTSAGELSVEAGEDGATIWRWELVDGASESTLIGDRGAVILEGAINVSLLDEGALIRLDSVAFPPGGNAMLPTHQGPGIRRLRDGTVRIDTEGHSSSYGPGGAWFETGHDPVFAQASETQESRFIRTMILPEHLAGTSSITYVREQDRNKPKSQQYRGYGETLLG